MAESANLALIHRQYANAGNRTVAEEVMASDVVWDITPGYPFGGVYTGHVIVMGHYGVKSHDGHSADARFVHIWTIRDNRITRLQQVADSHIVHQILAGEQN